MSKRMSMDGDGDHEMAGNAVPQAPAPVATVSVVAPPRPVPTVRPPTTPYQRLPPRSYEEWNYMMRRTMQEIIPGLYLGPYAAASKNQLDALRAAGITHIVCVRHLMERSVIRPVHPDHFTYLVVEMADDNTESLIPHIVKAHRFLENCFQSGGKALVHGNAGMSRSASLVVAYVMAIYGVSLKAALQFVQSKRFSANPNEWFLLQLKEYEAIYQAYHDVPLPLPADGETTRPSLKRQLELDTADLVDEDVDM